jgi:predicted PurR-regulated permease PerM
VKHLQSGDATRALQRLDVSNRMPWLKRIAPNFDPAAINPARVIMPIVQKAPSWIAEHGAGLIGGIAGVVIALFLVLLSAYFFYVEGETIVREAAALSPLPARYNHQFAENFKAVVDATFRGQVITSLTQGIFIGIGLAIAGVPGAILWGAVATVLSLLPIVGSAAVWVPAALWLYITATMGERSYFGVIFLTIWGVIVVPIIEHVVRPWAMKGKMQLPAIPLLVSVLGGMEAFGFVGLVVGPLVFSLLMSIIDIYKQSFRIPDSEGDTA